MVLWDEFEKVSTSEWLKKANIDLKGKKQAEDFIYKVCEGVDCSPFLTEGDVLSAKPIYGPSTKSGVHILADHPIAANSKAIPMLSFGVEALSFDVNDTWDLDLLFGNIYLEMVSVILQVEGSIDVVRHKVDVYIKKKYSGKTTNIIIISAKESHDTGIYLKYENTVSERLNLIKGHLDEMALNSSTTAPIIILDLKKDFLAQIAELRAIRKRMEQYKTVHPEIKSEVLLISRIHQEAYVSDQIHPLIICNYLIMSSYLGMSDFSFGVPFADDVEAARLCLNIQHIFKEESNLGYVSDPVAGSYIIEKLTEQMLLHLE
jgi:hypothetical protein